ncbi:metallophosphoesterase [Mumia zhuanghuii]|uniref:Metallophosphoesterase n=2 Tax=Mumia TaxID=1546255 RepID=A0ABW1QF16_9ACTN|nr:MULTISPECIES: metallophosphoesterase [Mumia]KAA1422904.1 metallophosphoesterase [Mumia zhuanghuii]
MAPTHRILHLSDTHVSREGPDMDGVDAFASLEQILRDVRHVPDLDLVVVSGDIADDGSYEGCVAVRELVGGFAEERGIPHVYTTGNHDDRDAFARALGSGHLGPDGRDVGRLAGGSSGKRAAVSEVSGLRVITLDSLVPGSVHGDLDGGQLAWLRGRLATPAPAGTIVVLHHPPLHVGWSPFMRKDGLHGGERLGDAVAGTDVRAVLCGHFHLQLSGMLGGVPVWVTPGVVTRNDRTCPPQLIRGVLGAGATVVDLGGPFSPTFLTLHARDPRAGEQVYVVDADSGADAEE